MRIFIDESGSFQKRSDGDLNLSCVGALVVPDQTHAAMIGRFNVMKRKWGAHTGEIKGSKLDERQVAAVIDLLIGCDCLFFVTATEMSVNDPVVMGNYQREQAKELTRALTEEAHPELAKQMTDLRARFEAMPTQLFLQAVLLMDLLKKVIDVATQHFALTSPREAGSFAWVVDAKGTARTPFENAWSMIAGGLIQGRYLDSEEPVVATGDFSHFQRFFTTEQNWPVHLPPPRSRNRTGDRTYIDLSRILRESFTFADSNAILGLQLADIVTNAFRRAMMDRLHPKGYRRLGQLMVRTGRLPFSVLSFAAPGTSPEIEEYVDPHTIIKSRSRPVGTRD